MKNITIYGPDGFTVIGTQYTLDAILAGAADTPIKFGIKSSGDEDWAATFKARIVPVGSSVGNAQLRIGLDTATLSPPWAVIGTLGSGGGSWGALGTQAAVVTAVNATGETVASMEATVALANLDDTITWAWQAVEGATGYNVYRRASPSGTYATPSLIGVTITETSVEDLGDPPSAGAPPIANTTGGAAPSYGSAPTLGLGPVPLGVLEIARWTYIWVKRITPSDVRSARYFGGIRFTEA
jgi:hypothetical protein